MKLIEVSDSDRKHKKLKAVFSDGHKTKTIHFGDNRYYDYLTFPEDEAEDKRKAYLKRHKKDLKSNTMSAGYLSYYILWGPYRSLERNISFYKNKFGY